MRSPRGGHQPPISADKLPIIRAERLSAIPWLLHGFSTRHGGVSQAYGGGALNLGITAEDTREAVAQNRDLFLEALGARDASVGRASGPGTRVGDPRHTLWPMVRMRQIHSSLIHRIQKTHTCPTRPDVGHHQELVHHEDIERRQDNRPLAGDGLITNVPGIVLSVRVADCLPVLIADPERRVVGAFHAGWRGTLERIVEKGVGEFRRQFGSNPAGLVAAIGPGIRGCCYEVGEELRDRFASQFAYAEALFEEVFSSDPVRRKYPLLFLNMRAPGHGEPPRTVHLDLVEANRRQLMDAGVRADNIWISDLCTSCRTDLLFSYRKERGKTGRMAAAIAIATSKTAARG